VQVIFAQPVAKPGGLDAHYRVGPGIEAVSAAENCDAYRVFLDLVTSAGERFLDDVPQEAACGLGCGERC